MKTVVIFGGTFDPVQLGHLAVAEQSHDGLQPDEFWFLVANVPGERKPVYAPAGIRLAMVRAAIADDPRFAANDLEIRRGGVTYTAETMSDLHRLEPDTSFRLLLGADSARSINEWRYGDVLLREESFVVVNRAGEEQVTPDDLTRLGYDAARLRLLQVDAPAVSASEVRGRAGRGESLDGLVPPAVAAIIAREQLYAQPRARA
ncbi:MAG: nicotinate (nicotinamide) nucleotide adenylyltransferase [Candidatus Dormibacteria bacterium]